MLLAARALGLGATLTTLYLQFEKEVDVKRQAIGTPDRHGKGSVPGEVRK
jgi:hypothetical protein